MQPKNTTTEALRRAKISATLKGRKKSPEHAANISAGKTGKPRPDMVGAGNWNWKESGISYTGVHYRASLVLPRECAHVDRSCKGMLDTAFRHDANPDLIAHDDPHGRPYYVGNPLDGYFTLCRSHHRRYDYSFA